MESNILLSVIIPFYNSSSYIGPCVQSLMEQTVKEGIEFIFVDDASTDDSCLVVKQLSGQYNCRRAQVRIVSYENHLGVAYARTIGIQEARGLYVGWCDADDWCDPTMFKKMLAAALQEDADIVVCDYQNHFGEQRIESVHRFYYTDPRIHLRRLYEQPDTNLFLWNKIFRRSILERYQISADPGINIGEDRSIMVKVFCHSHRLISLSESFYHHTVGLHASLVSSHDKYSRYRFEQDVANTDAVCQYLEQIDPKQFHLACQYIRFLTKWGYDRLLGWSRAYYDLYQETHFDIMHFTGLPFLIRLKLATIFCNYRFFQAYHYLKHYR